ncbi:RNA polymerase sigma-70 factor, ECF subfamily [Chitinophaga terrae (ex Kim and Jung 2007)]|uniref:RNA polymerase sigma-70 factor, ECF subfamily n=1 Tax=Chitinophaga terrae (ex Kim and Jung 2007) TaxID=408074 RepID=A0A1H4BBM5_9BACT|nr:sigma-70 family RNA polymerase sigma factor [Chitinophaga terrae (ex Kim and Jung 2007)]GEP92129.1 RNA polymerase subunit sigma-24 [Chitinophaga terrae (ex Kim and Jung 2007)]SEA45527.1 RNA polymerase sigma-70 factor, ECF subfamily [Chitinophaga terrae (ex Kim and Jung 2007)]
MSTLLTVASETDIDLINRVLNGEQAVYEQLIRRHNASLFRIGMSILQNDADVEDMMQTTYINAWQHLASFRNEAAFGTWLKRIMINECNQLLRKRKQQLQEDLSQHDAATQNIKESPENAVLNKELSVAMQKALLLLPEKYRAVFLLRVVENLSVAQTAEILAISQVNVKVRLIRAKLMLKEKVSNYYKNDLVFPFHLIRCDRIVNHLLNELNIKR